MSLTELETEGTVLVSRGQTERTVPKTRGPNSVYLYATLTETDPSYLMRVPEGIEMAEADAEFLKSLSCDATRKNVFGMSVGMLAAG